MSADSDRTKRSLKAIILKWVLPRLRYYGSFPAVVMAQNSDLTLELKPDDQDIPSHSSIKIRHGIPGAQVKVAVGSRVHLCFDAGDPSRPYAALWESGSVTELDLSATSIVLNSGTAAVGRVGDQVQVTFTVAEFAAMVPTCAATPGPVVVTTPVTLTGTITAGSPGVKA